MSDIGHTHRIYAIMPPRDRLRIWGAPRRQTSQGGANRPIYSNSFGGQSFMTVARSIYKAPQQETDRGGGYVLVRWVGAVQGLLSGQADEAGV